MSLDQSKAISLVSAQLGEGPWQLEPFGAGKFSETFLVVGPKGKYILRVAPPESLFQLFYEYRMMRQEPAIHAKLLKKTTVPVPVIEAHDFSRELIDRDYLIMSYIEGTPLSDANIGQSQYNNALRQWGGYVAQIHGVTDVEGRFGYLGEHNCMDPQPTWAEAFAIMYRKQLDDIVESGVYDLKTAETAMKMLEENLSSFEHCKTSHLLHGDLWVTNLLVDDNGDVKAVIDFDRACWGDPQLDLAIAEYCGVTRPAFWEGYGETINTEDHDAAIRHMFYLLYEHQKYIVISMSRRRNDPALARRYAAESMGVMQRFTRYGKPDFRTSF